MSEMMAFDGCICCSTVHLPQANNMGNNNKNRSFWCYLYILIPHAPEFLARIVYLTHIHIGFKFDCYRQGYITQRVTVHGLGSFSPP